jgi:CRISPR-associated endonuclease/helicase Cas3
LDFSEFFRTLTVTESEPSGKTPYPYQTRCAEAVFALLEIPTGLGKTEGVVAGWMWRLVCGDASTPRRLIYALPMRSLVEQTANRAKAMIECSRKAGIVPVARLRVVMGGDVGDEWFEEPEEPSIIVGTQDMLLSRALNRGYAMPRFQWPMSFGAINNDVLWVIDEVQLHGIGAVTAAQLQGLREKLGTFGPAQTTFMSATLDRSWLDTVDHKLDGRPSLRLGPDDLAFEPVRRIVNAEKIVRRIDAPDEASVAAAVIERHLAGTLTLVVLNTVERARIVYRHILVREPAAELVLLHSRFRPEDRSKHVEQLIRAIDDNGPGRLVVATQVIEAGIDVDAATLVTDAAPWSSIVQRFGRCNRRGARRDAVCYWLDRGELAEKTVVPYKLPDVQAARDQLEAFEGQSGAPAHLPQLPMSLESGLVLRRVDLLDLFDTSPDLSGHDVDVSRFIRDTDDITVSVFWRPEPPSEDDPPRREELCPAPLSDIRKLLKKLADHGQRAHARIVNQFGESGADAGRGVWVPLDERNLRPGLQVWLRSDAGWYDERSGFGESHQYVDPVPPEDCTRRFRDECATAEGDMGTRIGAAVTLSRHALDTADMAKTMLDQIGATVPDHIANAVIRAALWHDVGKAHQVFQDTMARANAGPPPPGDFWAKCVKAARHSRRGFRHELPGALAFLHTHDGDPDGNLIAYLIAAHHGKLRLTAQPLPSDLDSSSRRFLGVQDGDVLPAVKLSAAEASVEFKITLAAFQVGSIELGPTWIDRTTALRDSFTYGPFRLAYLELLVRVADWRASAPILDPAGVSA